MKKRISRVRHPRTRSSKKTTTVRATAANFLYQVLEQGQSLSSLLMEKQPDLKQQDGALLQEICFGVCRVLPRLESVITTLVEQPLKGKKRLVHCLLLVGLYQILYTRIPAHAAVDEVVGSAEELGVGGFRGLLNGVLRRFLREKDEIMRSVDQHWHTLHPDWLVDYLKADYTNWREIVNANNQKPPMWLRINLQRTSRENYLTLLDAQNMSAKIGKHPQSLCLERPSSVAALPHFSTGWVSVQDLHAQWAASLLDPQNGEWILDACAAPGGKTTHLLENAPLAHVVALDIDEKRLDRVRENLTRMGQQAQVISGDASQPANWAGQIHQGETGGKSAVFFDRILLDAPCSATGVIRRHPDIKWLRKQTDISELVLLQQKILTALWNTLKPGGILVYATCSLLKAENSDQIAKFIDSRDDVVLEPLPFPPQEGIVGYQFFPSDAQGDGFYYAKLRKRCEML